MNTLSVLTPAQLQTLVIAYAAVATLLIPVLGGVAVMAIQNFGKVKEAIGKLDAQNGDVSALKLQSIDHAAALVKLDTAVELLTPTPPLKVDAHIDPVNVVGTTPGQ